MEHLTFHVTQFRFQSFRGPVLFVAQDGVPDAGKVFPDLVRASCRNADRHMRGMW